jgi:hypothetical protein
MEDDAQPPKSARQQIKTRVLNMTLGQWMRAIDMVLNEYSPKDGSVEEEADYVTKLALLLMMTRWYDEADICLLLDSSTLRIPIKLSQTSKFDLTKILDRPPSDHDVIEDFEPEDPHASPHSSGEYDVSEFRKEKPEQDEPQAP